MTECSDWYLLRVSLALVWLTWPWHRRALLQKPARTKAFIVTADNDGDAPLPINASTVTSLSFSLYRYYQVSLVHDPRPFTNSYWSLPLTQPTVPHRTLHPPSSPPSWALLSVEKLPPRISILTPSTWPTTRAWTRTKLHQQNSSGSTACVRASPRKKCMSFSPPRLFPSTWGAAPRRWTAPNPNGSP